MIDILGFELDAGQKAKLSELHRLCAQRMAVKLPANLNSPRCAEYDTVQSLDARIEKYAPLLEFQKVEIRKELNAATGLFEDARGYQPVPVEQHARIVWQYYFIDHPITK